MPKKYTTAELNHLKENGVEILTLKEYKQKINAWGFDINLKRLIDMAAANCWAINDKLSISYNTSQAVLSEKLNGKCVGHANVVGYEIIAKDDPRRKAFSEFRQTEPYFVFNNMLWII